MSLSINTNTAAMAALQTLSQTTMQLNQTQNQVSTGYAVSTAADNPAIYAISQTMNSQISQLSGVQTGLSYMGQVMNTAAQGASSISGILTSMTSAIASAATGVSTDTINGQLSKYMSQINNFANTATFQGVNLLAGATGNGVQYTSASTAQDINGNVFTQTGFNATAAGLGLTGLNVNQSGAQVALGSNTFVDSDTTGSAGAAAATSLTLSNNVAAGTGTGQNPSVSYNFIMDSHTGGAVSSQASLASALNTATGLTNLTVGTDGSLSGAGISSSSTTTGVTTYSLSNGKSITASQDRSGNTVYTASTSFDANGNATAQSVIVDVNTSADASLSTQTNGAPVSAKAAGQRDTLEQAMSNQGFSATSDGNNNLTIAGNNLNVASVSVARTDNSSGSANASALTATTVSGYQVAASVVTAAITKMADISGTFGTSTNQLSQLQGSTSSLSSALTTGVGALTDADLASESAKLTSLQTKQQLAIQSLSIANSSSQTLMSLFRG